ncbi:MAG: hypothetical protein MPL62_00885 [Alphaproteobacteria bacterium]|nr:hypothetical protein [Alphaproteobacteria bacterium]
MNFSFFGGSRTATGIVGGESIRGRGGSLYLTPPPHLLHSAGEEQFN